MDRLVVSTDVYADPEAVYDLLLDFPRYERYSEYLDSVERTAGDGGAGSRYSMRFSWWKLAYTARSEVTEVDPPRRIDWRVLKDIEARGTWRIDPLDSLPADAPADADSGCEVRFEVRFDAESADASAVSLPAMVSFGWVLKRVKPLVREEAERVVERVVRDLEGRDRAVRLDIDTNSADL